MNLQQLDADRRAAHAAWVAAGSPDVGDLRDALDAAARAYAAAKKASAEPAPAVDVGARLDAALAARAARAADARESVRAVSAIRQAFAWPRCGQDFPATAAEKAAQRWAIKSYGSIDAALAALEIFS